MGLWELYSLVPSLSFGVFGMNLDDFRRTTAANTPSSSSKISLTGAGPLSGDVLALHNITAEAKFASFLNDCCVPQDITHNLWMECNTRSRSRYSATISTSK